MPKVFCPHCGGLKDPGKRCDCQPAPKRRTTPGDASRNLREPWRVDYSSAEYRKARQVAIERSNGHCVDCGVLCAEKIGGVWKTQRFGGEVDHEAMLRNGATSDPSGLALRCRKCHRGADAQRRRDWWPKG